MTTGSSTNSPIDMISHDRHFPDTVPRIWPHSYGWPCRRLRSDPRSRCLQSHNHSRYALQSRSGRLPARTLPNMSTAARARSAGTQGEQGRACLLPHTGTQSLQARGVKNTRTQKPRIRTPSRRSGARSCHAPGGDGCVRSAGGRAAVCGAPAGRVPVSGAFSSSPYTVPLCWVWGPGIAVLWSCQRIDVCDSVRLLYLLTYLIR